MCAAGDLRVIGNRGQRETCQMATSSFSIGIDSPSNHFRQVIEVALIDLDPSRLLSIVLRLVRGENNKRAVWIEKH